jgi:hypothetical protein
MTDKQIPEIGKLYTLKMRVEWARLPHLISAGADRNFTPLAIPRRLEKNEVFLVLEYPLKVKGWLLVLVKNEIFMMWRDEEMMILTEVQ